MSKSSEEVLLVIKHVRYKKTEGTLYMMGERMAWMLESKNVFSVSHLYADIKVQKISPDSKDKVQLQVVMHDGGASTFQFANPKGRTAQQEDRESVKELLQQLLPQFRRKVSSELEVKNKLLQEDPELFQLYKDLVVSQVITAEEFWASKAHKFGSSNKNDVKQNIGVSPAFLADIKPQTDGANGLKYNLTADIIESIFKTYPMVKKKHAECVPHSLSESEFWTRFFQSHYFHRDRVAITNKDIFSECAKHDEEEIKQEISQKVTNPLVDLTEIKDAAVDEDYRGITEDNRVSTNIMNQSLIRRFNHHSTMVLRTCQSELPAKSSENGMANEVEIAKGSILKESVTENGRIPKRTIGVSEKEPVLKKTHYQSVVELEDLGRERAVPAVSLRLDRMERYLHGPTPASASRYTSTEDAMAALHNITEQISSWRDSLTAVSAHHSLGVLGELSPGGALMHGTTQQQLQHMVSKEMQKELKHNYSALCELLRHFWSCFPTTTKFLEDKVVKMRTTLERFQSAKLFPLKEQLSHHHLSVDLIGHMEEMLSGAFNKFDQWQARRMSRKT
ncbi:general transcription factor IIH subunit 1-like isoform X2 [Pomacea canaliculata]|uniref:general transcription factor IIH subunit 1-like isoform X2 n=1 Tax=Pomacea canaliculata TaxID=400727 RepID=UPI000D72A108|nr:general transcription factor IIH subunit 1-like isoform X2 [Pomacea canaliculata]